ncbi:MAG: response regulator [Deltaproteobacteria bacterium]|jgi:signal transduction histidine kinase|nr:response regulator [Deltaproteobacteria bacterium]MBW2537091.1 response regulator [Deltaproteobacteria bacterium]
MTAKTTSRLPDWLAEARRPEVIEYRRELLDRIFKPFVAFGFVALSFGAWRAVQDGQWNFAVAYLGLYLAGVVVAVGAKRLSVEARSGALLGGLLALAVAALLRLGLGGVGALMLVAWCGLTGILRGVRASLVAVGLSIVSLGAVGAAMVQGIIVLPPDRVAVSLIPGAWVAVALTFGAVTAGLILPIHALSGKLTRTVTDLEESNERLRAEVARREQAEEALRASERRYRGIFESASVAILEEDLSEVRAALAQLGDDGVDDVPAYLADHPEFVARAASLVRVRDVNPATVATYRAESKEQLLAALDQIFLPESLAGFRDVLVALAEGRSEYRGESVNRTFRGDKIHVLLQASIPEELTENVLVSVLDVTERKRLERSLAEAQKMEAIGTLAGGIAHDFNNILMGIGGYAALLLRRLTEPGPHRGYLESIEQMVDSGASLTAQLLGFARGGKYDVHTIDLREHLHRSVSLFGRAKKEVQTHERLAQDLWPVEVDRNQLEQVMLNLYVNAWHAMPNGGELYVTADNVSLDEDAAERHGLRAGDYARIAVRDTGTGMDVPTRARVFEPFFTTKDLGHGTGLGLASAYGIVKNHGGTIEVESDVGEGATFIIHLPASDHSVSVEDEVEAPAERGDETVLLVDDQPGVLKSTSLMLEELGYRVITARSGERALAEFEKRQDEVALVMLDMILPSMSGPDIFDRLRALNPELPILLSSGYAEDERAEKLLLQGRAAFLHKPFALETLSTKLRDLLDG